MELPFEARVLLLHAVVILQLHPLLRTCLPRIVAPRHRLGVCLDCPLALAQFLHFLLRRKRLALRLLLGLLRRKRLALRLLLGLLRLKRLALRLLLGLVRLKRIALRLFLGLLRHKRLALRLLLGLLRFVFDGLFRLVRNMHRALRRLLGLLCFPRLTLRLHLGLLCVTGLLLGGDACRGLLGRLARALLLHRGRALVGTLLDARVVDCLARRLDLGLGVAQHLEHLVGEPVLDRGTQGDPGQQMGRAAPRQGTQARHARALYAYMFKA